MVFSLGPVCLPSAQHQMGPLLSTPITLELSLTFFFFFSKHATLTHRCHLTIRFVFFGWTFAKVWILQHNHFVGSQTSSLVDPSLCRDPYGVTPW